MHIFSILTLTIAAIQFLVYYNLELDLGSDFLITAGYLLSIAIFFSVTLNELIKLEKFRNKTWLSIGCIAILATTIWSYFYNAIDLYQQFIAIVFFLWYVAGIGISYTAVRISLSQPSQIVAIWIISTTGLVILAFPFTFCIIFYIFLKDYGTEIAILGWYTLATFFYLIGLITIERIFASIRNILIGNSPQN